MNENGGVHEPAGDHENMLSIQCRDLLYKRHFVKKKKTLKTAHHGKQHFLCSFLKYKSLQFYVCTVDNAKLLFNAKLSSQFTQITKLQKC